MRSGLGSVKYAAGAEQVVEEQVIFDEVLEFGVRYSQWLGKDCVLGDTGSPGRFCARE